MSHRVIPQTVASLPPGQAARHMALCALLVLGCGSSSGWPPFEEGCHEVAILPGGRGERRMAATSVEKVEDGYLITNPQWEGPRLTTTNVLVFYNEADERFCEPPEGESAAEDQSGARSIRERLDSLRRIDPDTLTEEEARKHQLRLSITRQVLEAHPGSSE